ncbi:MAG TPA: iron-sulfur cluster repair di-iron protein [Candidatus Acidoferrales bacterium]|nr:iron-sulfur cluster repair di-iron protein [Candidatus Acidoferrales bacterium]
MLTMVEVSMDFNIETKMQDIALANPTARQVLEDAGLDYCCGGGKSLHEACLHANVSSEEILNRLRENAKDTGPEDLNWMAAPLNELTRHICEKHHRYVREAIPRTRALSNKVVAKHGANHTELPDIGKLFAEVGREMIMHMQKEEQILFPYIDTLQQAANAHGSVEPPFFQTVKNPIHAMMQEHDAAGDLVRQIRVLSSEYTPPGDACTSFKALYEALREFEADLHQHVHLENNVLFPRAVELEASAP